MEAALQQLKSLVDATSPLPPEAWEALASIWQPGSAKRKEVLTAAGSPEKYLYFITSGVQRVCYFDAQAHEATLVFTYAPSFGGVLDAMLLGKPASYSYETLTQSTFLRAQVADLKAAMAEYPAVLEMVHIGVTHALSGVLERLAELQSFSSEEKFRKLLQRSPHILQLVPHKYLANYLGIDPTNFSKLINRVQI
jgi:CRP-like cAMP-binding protein